LLSAVTTNDVGNYTVLITNTWGSVTSSVASLTMVFPPTITRQPQSLTATNGSPASFSFKARGTPPLSYHWQKNGLALTDGGNLSGSATTNLVLSATTTNDAGNYAVVVTNTWGSITSVVATLTIVSPPMITQQPTNETVLAGSLASFSVTAMGTAPLGYQWQKNGIGLTNGGTLSGTATTNLVLSAVTTNDAGTYTVIITNSVGSVTSSVAIFTVVLPPVITQQPSNEMVLAGSAASFGVTATGTAPLGYQWQKNGVALTDGGTLSGSATSNLILSAAAANDAGNYTVVITNTWGSVTSSVVTLTVVLPPGITRQPQSLTVTNGGLASFNVIASGTAPLGYQWQKNGIALTNSGTVSGTTATNLVLSATTTNDSGGYTVIITNNWGSVTSSVAILTVVFPPVITRQPQGLTMTNGSAASFSVTATGTAPLSYQWQKNGLALTDGGTLSGSATSNLVLSAVTTNDAGSYIVIITNAGSSITSSVATLAVVLPPMITLQPQSLTVTNGSAASFSVTAAGSAPLGYQWRKNGLALTDGGTLSGSTSSNLVLSAAATSDAGNYAVVVTNTWGSVTSSVAILAVVFPPAITRQPQSLIVTNGNPAGFGVTASGTAPLGYQWQKNGLVLTDGGTLSGSTTSNMLLSVTAMNDAGSYAVIVTNTWGSVTSSVATLTVLSSPVITSQPQSLTVARNSNASFSVTAAGTAPLGYRWQKDGVALTDGGGLSGSTTSNLVVSAANTKDVGNYTVVITNTWGSVTSSVAALTVVTFSPVITSQPQSLTVTNGSAAGFSVTASGKAPLSYQWLKSGVVLTNGGTISGSATSNLVLSAATTNDAGNYTVIITNTAGSITSSIAILTVVFPPVITHQPQSLTVTNGSAASFSVMASGTPPLVYQWQRNGLVLADGGALSGSATSNLVLSAATTNDAGNYTVVVTNTWGNVTSSIAALAVVLPPTITRQPQNQAVTNGSAASFSVAATGTAPLGYRWQKNGVALIDGGALSGAATSNLVLSATTMNDAGNYAVIITNTWGSVTSSIAILTTVFPPVITRQPQGLTVTNGAAAGFSVMVSGATPLGYRWQKDGVPLTDGGTLSGSATTNLVLSAATTNDAGNYAVVITNTWGNVTSSLAALTVVLPPTISLQPKSLTVTNGAAASFSVTASGTMPLSYQWQKNGLALTNGGTLSDSTTNNLALATTTTNDTGNYTVAITNIGGSVTSSVAVLTVVIPPAITQQPQSLTVTNGGTASFSVTASGSAPFGYQWQKNGLALTDGGTLSGAATTNLEMSAVTTNDAGNYAVVITNAWGSVTSSGAVLTVVSPPAITSEPQSLTVTNTGAASFSVTATGTAPLSYQWQKNGVALTNGGTLSGSATSNLVLSATTVNDAGNYTVIVTNTGGSVISSVAALTIVFPPIITSQPHSLTVTNSNPASFSVTALGAIPLSYQWQKNGVTLTDGGNLSGSTTTNLLLNPATINDAGNYAVIVTNTSGSVTSSVVMLTVVSPPIITQQPTNEIVVVGSSASFSVTANGAPSVSYQWIFNGTNISGATNTSLVLSNVQAIRAGTYAVLVTNLLGSLLSSNAVLTVVPDHFSWAQIPTPQLVNTPFSVTIQARDMTNGVFTNFTGAAFLDSTNGVAVSPALTGNFVQGTWAGTVLVSQMATNLVLRASDGFGHFGLANPIDAVAFPALTMRISSHTLQLLWPVSDSAFVLETSGDLSPPSWTVMSAPPIRLGNQFLVLVQISGTNSFYRFVFTGP
jgi:uncharacterized repeat protein (TIGR01451 family)